jgi:hypothetical protein
MPSCRHCGGNVEAQFRFCPWCAAPQRRKLVEFFPAHRRDRGKALRVSRYLDPEPQVRFSVWDDHGRAEAAVSVSEAEAARLSRFLRPVRSKPTGLAMLRSYAAGLSAWRSSTGSRNTTSS